MIKSLRARARFAAPLAVPGSLETLAPSASRAHRQGVIGRCAEEAIVIDVLDASSELPEGTRGYKAHSVLCVPLIPPDGATAGTTDGGAVGVLLLANRLFHEVRVCGQCVGLSPKRCLACFQFSSATADLLFRFIVGNIKIRFKMAFKDQITLHQLLCVRLTPPQIVKRPTFQTTAHC